MAFGQSEPPRSSQFRFDYDPTWQLSRRWVFDTEFTAHFADAAPSWWEASATPNLEFSPRRWIDLTGGVALTYTNQTDSFDSFETRPYVGLRLKWDTNWRGIRLINYSRFEGRIQRNLETGETKIDRRTRSRIQAFIPINKRSLSEDQTWYAITDAEWFWTADDEQVQERFKSKERYRVGIAWRRNATWTFQFIYTLQRSRNNIDDPFSTTDDIFRFRFIHTLR